MDIIPEPLYGWVQYDLIEDLCRCDQYDLIEDLYGCDHYDLSEDQYRCDQYDLSEDGCDRYMKHQPRLCHPSAAG